MNTNSALIVPAQSPAATNAAPLDFSRRPQAAHRHSQCLAVGYLDRRRFWLLAVAAWLLWRYWRKEAPPFRCAPPVPPHVRARRMLEARAGRCISDPKPFSIAVSGAIRVYLEERFNFHAPDRTTEEFLYELQGTNLLTAEQKHSLAEFLANCDLIKFAKYEPTETELRALHAAALRLVNETEPR